MPREAGPHNREVFLSSIDGIRWLMLLTELLNIKPSLCIPNLSSDKSPHQLPLAIGKPVGCNRDDISVIKSYSP